MDVKQIFSLIKRWLWLVILGAIIGAGLGYFLSNRETPIYQATTRFVVLRSAQTTYDYYNYLEGQQLVSTYAQLLTTEKLLLEAYEKLGFPVQKGQVTAQQIEDTQFVQLTVKDPDPFKAMTIANGMVDVLIDQSAQLQTVKYDAAEKSLQDRIDTSLEQISLLESQITNISADVLDKQITTVQQEMAGVQDQVDVIKMAMAKIDPLSVLEEDRAKLNEYQNKLDELTPILTLYQNIYTDLVVLGQTSDSGDLIQPTQLEQLKTTLNLYQQIYLSSINSMETLKLSKAQNTPTVQSVEAAVKPTMPISPKPGQTAMIGAAIGLLVTAGFAFLVEFLDDTLKTPDEIKEVLELPVIGFVAEIRNGESKKGESLGKFVARHPRSPVSEAFRSLRTNLEFSGVDKPLKVVLVTSSGESEGKSTIAANLAIVVAQSGKQVLILDADMRRPTMHTQFEKTNRVGLSDLLTHKLAAEDVIKPLERIPNLHMITCGKRPPNPSELLGSERMAQLINVFRDSYDFVIIDCPPLLVSDAQILSTKVDGTIMVVQHGHTRAIAALRPLEELRRIGAKVVGVVMNRIPRNRDYYYGGYYYYSPYVSQTEEGQGGETVRHKRSSSSRRRGWFGRSASTEKPVDELSEVEQGQESS